MVGHPRSVPFWGINHKTPYDREVAISLIGASGRTAPGGRRAIRREPAEAGVSLNLCLEILTIHSKARGHHFRAEKCEHAYSDCLPSGSSEIKLYFDSQIENRNPSHEFWNMRVQTSGWFSRNEKSASHLELSKSTSFSTRIAKIATLTFG